MDASGAGRIENAFGAINDGECWGRRAPWCDYTGPVNGTTVGIAIFDHPGNLRHPTYWHVRNYGLMTANPFGVGYFRGTPGEPMGVHTLPAGERMTFRYRLFIHAGDARQARVGEQYHGWINPPAVTVEA